MKKLLLIPLLFFTAQVQSSEVPSFAGYVTCHSAQCGDFFNVVNFGKNWLIEQKCGASGNCNHLRPGRLFLVHIHVMSGPMMDGYDVVYVVVDIAGPQPHTIAATSDIRSCADIGEHGGFPNN